MGFISGRNDICKMCHGALVSMNGVCIFDKYTFAVEMCKFRSFFSDQVHFARLKVGWINQLKRTHISDAYYMNLFYFVQFYEVD
jgi:hypothetical protein